jgi:hypothetical protein
VISVAAVISNEGVSVGVNVANTPLPTVVVKDGVDNGEIGKGGVPAGVSKGVAIGEDTSGKADALVAKGVAVAVTDVLARTASPSRALTDGGVAIAREYTATDGANNRLSVVNT